MGMKALQAAALAVGLFGASTLAGCAAGITAVEAGRYEPIEAYSVQLGRQWSDISGITGLSANVRTLTIDGVLLNRLTIAEDIEPGAGLQRRPTRDATVPVFRDDMTSREVVEFVTQSVEQWGLLNVETEALLPAEFAGRPGVAFNFSGQSTEGLNYSGRAAAAALNNKLQLMVYFAPSEHYYARHQAEVDGIFASVVRVQTPPARPAAAPAVVEPAALEAAPSAPAAPEGAVEEPPEEPITIDQVLPADRAGLSS